MDTGSSHEETVRRREVLHRLLSRAADRDLVGRTVDVDDLIDHALAFVELLPGGQEFSGSGVDLGSGGGIPGLVVGMFAPRSSWALVDSQAVRADWLDQACLELGLDGRVGALHSRAETLGRQPDWREGVDAVTARLFGPPAVVAEVGSGLLRVGGRLIVSDRKGPDRWDRGALADLGLERTVASEGFVVLVKKGHLPVRFPRRDGVPERKPLF
ncbi:MAG: hypothetical protein GY929_25005 [Actinomycetia bacterium]|nr:hypothetical protein [Actinomycetes bacterium]